jgi:Tfp pilus assembly protein PilP
VSESTSILGNSTITSRKTAERSSRTNIRTIQAQEVSLETAKTFYMLPNGVAKLRFNAAYGSNYKISLANSSQMGVKFDGVSTAFSGNVINKNLSAGSRIIDITGTNSSKLTSTITIEPDTVAATTASKATTIKGSESYLLKITSLSQVKALATGNSNVGVDKIFINNSWTTYSTYGTIAPTSALTHPFTLGNYYVILKNQSTAATSIAFTIAEPATLSINTAKSIAVNSGNYTYVKFTADSTGGKYNITASNSTGLAFTTLKSTGTNLSTVSGDFYPGYFFEIGFDAGNSYYVGIKNTSGATNTLTIKKSTDTLYQWQITGGTLGTVTTSTNTYELTRGYNYSLTLFANGVAVGNGTAIGNAYFGYDNQSTAYGVYSISNPLNNQITINANSPLGGNGIIVTAKMKNSLGQQVSVDTLKIVPKFEEKASITSINNTEDLSFNYSVPKYVYKFEYKIWPNNTVFTANIGASKAVSADTVTGTISFLSNYNSLNYTSVQTMHIDIIKIYYLNAFQQEVGVTKSILGATSFNNLFAGGSGTASSPYLISTLRHFNNIKHFAGSTGNGKYFKQTATLTFSGAHDLHTTSFYGTYDGGGNTITGIRYTINATPQHTDIGGLFGINYGTIKSLNIKKLTINSAVPDHSTESWISVGGVVATNYGLLSSVDVYDGSIITVNRMNSHTGGIVGYNMIVGGLYTTLTVSGTSRNYNVYGCDFGFSSGAESKVYSNGYVGGVVGVNNGNLYSSWAGSYAQVELYQIGANNRAIGGIVGYNNYGYVVSCNNRSTITYKSPKDENKDIAPMMGKIAGLNYGSGNLISSDQGGTLDAGNLITHNGFLGIGSYNQKKYFGAHYDQGIGLNNP